MLPTRQEIIDCFNHAAERMERVASDLSEQDLDNAVYAGWTAREVLCHLADGSQAARSFIARAEQDQPRVNPDFDQDDDNESRVAEWRDKPLSDLLAAFEKGTEASLDAIESVSDELLARQVNPGVGRRTLADQLRDVAGHTIDHVNDIERALKDAGESPT